MDRMDAIRERAEDAARNRHLYGKRSRSRRITNEASAADVFDLLNTLNLKDKTVQEALDLMKEHQEDILRLQKRVKEKDDAYEDLLFRSTNGQAQLSGQLNEAQEKLDQLRPLFEKGYLGWGDLDDMSRSQLLKKFDEVYTRTQQVRQILNGDSFAEMPVGTVLRDNVGSIYEKHERNWKRVGVSGYFVTDLIQSPVTILHKPEES